MASGANSIRSTCHTLAAALCLIAVLLLSTPCSTAQPPPAAPAMHCAACCGANPVLDARQLCCARNPQPAQPTAAASANAAVRTVEVLSPPSQLPLSDQRTTSLTSVSLSPPPLHTILRI